MKTLSERVYLLEIDRWTVIRNTYLRAYVACDPNFDGSYEMITSCLDKMFDTFQEAINYATQQAVNDARSRHNGSVWLLCSP